MEEEVTLYIISIYIIVNISKLVFIRPHGYYTYVLYMGILTYEEVGP